MGRKLDALLGKNFKTSKFKTLAKLAVSRSAILKNQKQVWCQQAKSDVVELLKLGHQERALLRVELVIKDQDLVDAFDMIEDYCHLLSERVALLQKNKECPEELLEAVSGLIYASSRCGEFPELQGIRRIFVSRFGKEFADRAIELRNNCRVNPKIIQKLSVRQPSMESKLNELKQIASKNGIILRLEEETSVVAKKKVEVSQTGKQLESDKLNKLADSKPQDKPHVLHEEKNHDGSSSGSLKHRKKYTDVATAALDAFVSAAYAAAAARAAVELSKSGSQDNDQDHNNGSNHHRGIRHNIGRFEALEENEKLTFDKTYPMQNFSSESEGEHKTDNRRRIQHKEGEESQKKAEIERRLSTSSTDSDRNENDLLKILSGSVVVYNDRPIIPTENQQHISKYPTFTDRDWPNQKECRLPFHPPKSDLKKSKEDGHVNLTYGKAKPAADFGKKVNMQHFRLDSKPVSVRTRKGGGN